MNRVFTVTPNPGLDRTLTTPVIIHNEVLRATDVRLDAGGKGFNVARALKALGMESTALGFLGGATGRRLEEELARVGVAGEFIYIAHETRTNFVVTTPDGRDHVKVNEPGPIIQATEIDAFYHLVDDHIREGDFWVLSGSLARGLPLDFYAALINRVQERGAYAFLDASGPALLAGIAAQPFLVKPNVTEAAHATGIPIESEQAAQAAVCALLDQGVQMVALSLGAEGLLLANAATSVRVKPPQVHALNTVGAGDALLAGLVWALAQGFPVAEIARWGVACGSAAAALPGVDFASFSAVREMYERCILL